MTATIATQDIDQELESAVRNQAAVNTALADAKSALASAQAERRNCEQGVSGPSIEEWAARMGALDVQIQESIHRIDTLTAGLRVAGQTVNNVRGRIRERDRASAREQATRIIAEQAPLLAKLSRLQGELQSLHDRGLVQLNSVFFVVHLGMQAERVARWMAEAQKLGVKAPSV